MKYLHIITISVLLIGCGGQSIHQDVIEGNVALVRRELSKGVDVNQKNDEGRTPLHLAAGIANKKIADLLIEKGANINSRDKRGLTPLDYAVEGEEMSDAFSEISNMKGVEVVSSNSYVRNEDGSLREKKVNKTEIKEVVELLRKHGGKTGEELTDGEPVAEVAKTKSPTTKGTDHSGKYTLSIAELEAETNFELKPDGSLHGKHSMESGNDLIGSWKIEGDLLICEGTTEKSSQVVIFKFNKKTVKVESMNVDGNETLIKNLIPEGEDGLYFKKN